MTSSTHIYLDLDVINNDSTTNNDPPVLNFQELRNAPFLKDTEEYFCSIVRFSLQTGSSLPVFIPRVQIGQSDPNLLVYKVSMVYIQNGAVIAQNTQAVSYSPQNNQPTPLAPIKSQDLSTTYYYMHSYQEFITMINTALTLCYNGLGMQSGVDIPAHGAPFLMFDPDQGKALIYGNQAIFDNSRTTNKVELWFNSRLFELLSSFPSYDAGPVGDQNYRIKFTNYNNANVAKVSYNDPITGAAINYNAIQAFQEVSTIALWNPIASIVFSSALLPVLSTNISPPQVYNDPSNSLNSTGNNSGIFNILTDFEVPYSAINQYRPTVDYNPGTEYRLLDMNSIMNLNKIDITVFWKTHYGEYIPFRLQPGCAAHLKIMFRKRTFYFGV